MNVLCLEQFSNLGGGQRSLLDLLPAFAERQWKVLVTAPEGPFTETCRRLGQRTANLQFHSYTSIKKPVSEFWRYAFEIPRLVDQIRQLAKMNSIDLLYVNGPRLLPSAALVSKCDSIPLVFHCHNRLQQLSAVVLAGRALQLASGRVIACCQYAVDPLRGYIDNQKLFVLYNGVRALNEFTSWPTPKLRRIGVIGRVETEKGQMEFVCAARIVLKEFPDCRFSVIGAPLFSNADYYNQVVAASMGLPIEFPGWQNDAAKLFSNLDLLIVPSTPLEATTRVILEAYSAGVPVVAFACGGIPEIVEDNETGFLAMDSTPEALARRIIAVLRMESSDVAIVVSKANQRWQNQHRLEIYQERVCEVLSRAAA